jgi:copper chaperone NosL
VRDAVAFTMLPEMPRTIAAVYVTDMAHARNWQAAGAGAWIDARKAFYVIDSQARSGMDTAEAVPFGDRAAADEFAAAHGGRIVAFSDIPRAYILGTDGS